MYPAANRLSLTFLCLSLHQYDWERRGKIALIAIFQLFSNILWAAATAVCPWHILASAAFAAQYMVQSHHSGGCATLNFVASLVSDWCRFWRHSSTVVQRMASFLQASAAWCCVTLVLLHWWPKLFAVKLTFKLLLSAPCKSSLVSWTLPGSLCKSDVLSCELCVHTWRESNWTLLSLSNVSCSTPACACQSVLVQTH